MNYFGEFYRLVNYKQSNKQNINGKTAK